MNVPDNSDRRPAGKAETLSLLRLAAKTLDDKKAEELTILDVRGLSPVTDYYLIACGLSQPHLKALSEELQVSLKKQAGFHVYRRAGTPESEWMALDYVDVVVHLFSPQARSFYDLETLWADAPRMGIDDLVPA